MAGAGQSGPAAELDSRLDAIAGDNTTAQSDRWPLDRLSAVCQQPLPVPFLVVIVPVVLFVFVVFLS